MLSRKYRGQMRSLYKKSDKTDIYHLGKPETLQILCFSFWREMSMANAEL